MTAPLPETRPGPVRLGLIGDTIAASRAPLLHRLAGAQAGLSVTYDRLVPAELGLSFDAVFDRARDQGFRGLNITYPYKERAAARVVIPDPLVRAMGAVNTVIFGPSGPQGHNTDHSGFVAALAGRRPGRVALIGAGGAGRAVAFGLIRLAADAVRLTDRDRSRAEALAAALRHHASCPVSVHDSADEAAAGADGLVNCTPVGMVGHPGTPLPAAAMTGAAWAFDAVYTPQDTRFLADAAAAGLEVVAGWELFFHQGLHAFALFTGREADPARLRAALLAAPPGSDGP